MNPTEKAYIFSQSCLLRIQRYPLFGHQGNTLLVELFRSRWINSEGVFILWFQNRYNTPACLVCSTEDTIDPDIASFCNSLSVIRLKSK